MLRMTATFIAMMLTTSMAFAQTEGQAKPRWEHKKGEALSLMQGGKPVLTYHFAPGDNSPYFHPVSVAGGPVMSVLEPKDHMWHKGLWFSWKYLNRVNFWEYRQGSGKQPGGLSGQPEGWSKRQGEETVNINEREAAIEMTLAYGKDETVFMKEARRLAITPREDGGCTIDWRSTFTADAGEVLIDRAVPQPTTGGYAGLSFRGVTNFKDITFTNSQGTTGQTCRGQQAAWVDMTGTLDEQFGPTGVTIFDHPGNPRHPTPWHVQATAPYYMFNAALVYNEPLTLKAGESLTLRYRVLVHKGKLGAEKLNEEFEAYKKAN